MILATIKRDYNSWRVCHVVSFDEPYSDFPVDMIQLDYFKEILEMIKKTSCSVYGDPCPACIAKSVLEKLK